MTMAADFIDTWCDEHGTPPQSHWVICSDCRGEGTSTAYLGAYTESDRAEMGEEWYEFAADIQAGHYDRNCEGCGGTGKVREFDGEAADEWALWVAGAAEDAAIRRAESGYQW